MKILIASLLCLASTTAFADDTDMRKARAELSTGCAQSYASFVAHNPAGTEFRGDRFAGDAQYYAEAKPCTEEQLAAYLDKAEPTLVMRGYPSAAGRPMAKKPATPPPAASK